LDQLRDRLTEAELAARKLPRHIKGKRPRLPDGVEFGRERATPLPNIPSTCAYAGHFRLGAKVSAR
jgi:hypothetical protein